MNHRLRVCTKVYPSCPSDNRSLLNIFTDSSERKHDFNHAYKSQHIISPKTQQNDIQILGIEFSI